jgi:LysM repeat protein
MTTPVDEPAAPPRAPDEPVLAEPVLAEPVAAADSDVAPPRIEDICPYLLAGGGGWRSANPSRDHRCTAVDPPAPLATDKQRVLCLVAAHGGCPAYRAARAARALMLAPGHDPAIVAAADAARRPVARATPVVLEGPRLSIGGMGAGGWAVSQWALVGLMILAFAVVLVARFSTPESSGASPSAAPTATASPSLSPTPRPTPSPSPSPAGSGAAPSGSGAVASPAAPSQAAASQAAVRTTYRVKSGDTLVGIAASFGTTVAAIQQLNGLSGSDLKIGQLLKIP